MEGGGSLMHSQEIGSSSQKAKCRGVCAEHRHGASQGEPLAQGVAENTIWGKVVASPESGLWCVLWSKVPVACPNTQGCPGM
jgi:hypothetical protein